MRKSKSRWLKVTLILAGLVLAICILAGPVQITYNLTVRAGAARKLAESFQHSYLKLEISGGASYEGSRLFFHIKGDADDRNARSNDEDRAEEAAKARQGARSA